MTRDEIKAAFLKICPPAYREKQDPVWFSRVARVLSKEDPQWETKTVRYLWKDERASLEYWQGASIQKALTKSSEYLAQPRAIIQKNNEDLEEIREFKKQIRREILDELVGSFKRLAEADVR